jgi:hypothetical protein
VFGGMNHTQGYCGNDVFCLDLKTFMVKEHISNFRKANDELMAVIRQQEHAINERNK